MAKENNEFLFSIIILNYNGAKYLLECVDSVYKTMGCKLEVILIDNNSSDNSQLVCKEKFPEVILIQNKENIGLSARNIGIKKAMGDFIVFLDSDTVVNPNWLITLLNSFEKNGDGLYQPKILSLKDPTIIQSTGNMINIFGLGYSRGKGEKDCGQYNKFQTISFTAGTCTFSSSDIIRKIGEVDKIFFAYHDDLDYGWRAWLLDVPSNYEPKSIVYHLESPTLKWTAKKFFFLERNRWICLLYLYSRKSLLRIFPLLIIIEIGIFFFLLSKGFTKSKVNSFFSLFKLYSDIKKRHKKISKIRKVSDKKVIKNFVNEFYLPPILIGTNSSHQLNQFIVSLSKLGRRLINL